MPDLRSSTVFCRVIILILLFVSPRPAVAQSSSDPEIYGPPAPAFPSVIARDEQGRVTIRATKLTIPVEFDGRLEESFYREIPSFGDFIQQEPHSGQPSAEKTEVWAVYDRENLYISARLWESRPNQRVATDMRRETGAVSSDDHFAVAFDGFYDRRNGYGMTVNSLGGMQDWSISNEQPSGNWSGIWDVRTADFEDGWTVEIQLPFRSFRFREGGHIWGVNFRRQVRAINEVSFLAPIPVAWGRTGVSKMSVAATLTGLEVPERGKNLDIKPYALGSVLTDKKAVNPYSHDPNSDIGIDMKWGIRQTLVANLTVNTDFAQVEDDEAQVNLTRFSLQFPEKREFFLEGADLFAFGGGQGAGTLPVLFYSRRIGIGNGLEVPIRAGGRLTGNLGPWRFGGLNIQTAESVDANAASTNFSVLRVSRDIFQRSRVGVIATRRDPIASSAIGAAAGNNLAYGIDTSLIPSDNVTIAGYVAKTDSPDRRGDDLSYRGRLEWSADRYGLQAEHLAVEPNFNPEIGFLRRTSFRRSFGQARFSPRPGWRGVRKVFYTADIDYVTDINNRPESKEFQGTYRMEFDNSDAWNVDVTRTYDRLTRPFEVAKRVVVPSGEYTYQQVRGSYSLGRSAGFRARSARRAAGCMTPRCRKSHGAAVSESTIAST